MSSYLLFYTDYFLLVIGSERWKIWIWVSMRNLLPLGIFWDVITMKVERHPYACTHKPRYKDDYYNSWMIIIIICFHVNSVTPTGPYYKWKWLINVSVVYTSLLNVLIHIYSIVSLLPNLYKEWTPITTLSLILINR